MIYAFLVALLSLGFVIVLMRRIKNAPSEASIEKIADIIRNGAFSYLKRQYKTVGIFAIIIFGILFVISQLGYIPIFTPYAFLSGIFFSALSGRIGIKGSTNANGKTTFASKFSLNRGLRVAFEGGSIMGYIVPGLALLDLTLWYFGLRWYFASSGLPENIIVKEIASIIITFGMGASFQALFARLGGGIYTKAADMGADLVGKLEENIPEDDIRNPATVADNVGDNVGDVAGMGADLYESFVGGIAAAMLIFVTTFPKEAVKAMTLPVLISAFGVIASFIGFFFVKTKEGASQKNLLTAIRRGNWISTIVLIIGSYFIVKAMLPNNTNLWYCIIIGILVGNFLGYFTEVFTSSHYKSTQSIVRATAGGHATTILEGIAVGLQSTFPQTIILVSGTIAAFYSAGGSEQNQILGMCGIAIAAVSMLATLPYTLSLDAQGPITDNAGGIAEMTHQNKEVRERTDALDSLGNTTAATGKGYAIGSAAFTALILIYSYMQEAQTAAIKIGIDPTINTSMTSIKGLVGIFIGSMLVFLFSSTTIRAVGRAANVMVKEVRRQFKELNLLKNPNSVPDYNKCIEVSTIAAQKEMILPAMIGLLSPLIIGFIGGPAMVIGLLIGATVTGYMMGTFMNNSGGSWDNAKKFIEGLSGGRGSESHKAAITGDTAGDPFKDTSGPSINILIKLMSIISIVFAPVIVRFHIF